MHVGGSCIGWVDHQVFCILLQLLYMCSLGWLSLHSLLNANPYHLVLPIALRLRDSGSNRVLAAPEVQARCQ